MNSPASDCDVAFVFDSGFGCGGAERVAVQLIRHWRHGGREVALVTMTGPELDFYAVPPGVRRIVTGGVALSTNRIMGALQNVRRLLRLRAALRSCGAPVVLSFGTRTNIRVAFASLGLGKRVVLSERSDPSRQRFGWQWQLLRKIIYRYADVVTANSRNALEYLKALVPPEKLALTPNPLSLPDSGADVAHSRTILNVGSLKWHKGQSLLIDAVARLGDVASEWTVSLVGDGPERAKLEAEVLAHAVADRVVFHGLVPDPERYYQAAGMFVFPSLFEGTPNALLEAMAHGLPCVVSDALPGALEYIENGVTGLTFRTGDAFDLASKIAILVRDSALRAKLGAAARARMDLAASTHDEAVWDALLWPAHSPA